MTTLLDWLQSKGVRRISGAHGQFIRGLCPFHNHEGQKTFWADPNSGRWGCWSARCPRHRGGSFIQFLYATGMDPRRAAVAAAALNLAPPETSNNVGPQNPDAEMAGRVRLSHIIGWQVRWDVVEQVCSIVENHPAPQVHVPLEEWADVPVVPGDVEHDHWRALGYPLRRRRILHYAMTRLGVAYDRDAGDIVFPLVRPGGGLAGIARRAPRDGVKYVTSGSPFPFGHPEYETRHVDRGDLLWGWWEQRDLISANVPVVVVEGYFDALRVAEAGWVGVAKSGSRLTAGQAALLNQVSNPKILWPDNDAAGLAGVLSDVQALGGSHVKVVIPTTGLHDAGDCPSELVHAFLLDASPTAAFLAQYPLLLNAARNRLTRPSPATHNAS